MSRTIDSFLNDKLRFVGPFFMSFYDKQDKRMVFDGSTSKIFTEEYRTEEGYQSRFRSAHNMWKNRYTLLVHDADNKFVEEYDCT
jgi:hypothetical protein